MKFVERAVDMVRERRWLTATFIMLTIVFMTSTIFVSCASGPDYPKGVAQEVQYDRMRLEKFIDLMGQGKTTREQEQEMLKATKEVFKSLEKVMFQEDGKAAPAENK